MTIAVGAGKNSLLKSRGNALGFPLSVGGAIIIATVAIHTVVQYRTTASNAEN